MPSPMKLWKSGVGMAKAVARRRARRLHGVQAEDLEQAALLALWKAAKIYREGSGASFTSFAWHYVRGEVNCERWRHCLFGFKAGKAQAYKKYEPPEFFAVAEGDGVSVPACRFDDEDYLVEVVRRLPAGLRRVAQLYWVEGVPSKRVAEALGLSLSRVEQLHREAFRRMVAAAGTMQDIGWLKERSHS